MSNDRERSWDAIVLAGGRSSRLQGRDKTALLHDGRSLLDHALAAAFPARAIAVIGPDELTSRLGIARSHASVVVATEHPRFGGPACAVARGFEVLAGGSDWTAVVASDLPNVRAALEALLVKRPMHARSDALMAIDEGGRQQPLLAIYRTSALARALAARGSADGLSMRSLTSGLSIAAIPLRDSLCADIDTPEDAARYDIELPMGVQAHG
jgi:molybdopterin-guanine dinucleotide biosynthesis protein A